MSLHQTLLGLKVSGGTNKKKKCFEESGQDEKDPKVKQLEYILMKIKR